MKKKKKGRCVYDPCGPRVEGYSCVGLMFSIEGLSMKKISDICGLGMRV